MNLLLDTHVLLWWQFEDPRLRANARTAIAEAEAVFISAVSAWEIAIKISAGRLHLPEPIKHAMEASGFRALSITFEHAAQVAALPRHHADPFDRMLIAQAQGEDLSLVTNDRRIGDYDVPIIWASAGSSGFHEDEPGNPPNYRIAP